jgi:peptidoglycan/LPS O-acetylase OafA/YrhL
MNTPRYAALEESAVKLASNDSKYRADIDGLRAVAVVLVVLFHAFPSVVPGGYVGVDVFFVISGFLISTILLGSLSDNTFSLVNFYERRIRRIFPALSVILAFVMVVGWFTILADEYAQLGKHVAGGAGFIANFVLLSEVGYFDTSSETKPLLHLWSLGIEEQFYIFYPIAFVFAARWRHGILTLIVTMAVASFLANVTFVNTSRAEVFYLPFTRMWELLIGASLACGGFYGRCSSRTLGAIASLLGLSLIITSAAVLNNESVFPGFNALLPSVGAALIVWAGAGGLLNRGLLSNRTLVGIGLVSYPLYLWHWPLISLGRILGYQSTVARLALVLASVVLSVMTYYLVEKPIRFRAKGHGAVLALVAVMIVLGSVGWITHHYNGFKQREAHTRYGVNADQLAHKPSPAARYACPPEVGNKQLEMNYCHVSRQAPPTNALLGDSHADDKFHGLAKLDTSRTWLLLGNSSCAPLRGIIVKGDRPQCKEKMEGAIQYLLRTPAITTVVLSFFMPIVLDVPFAADHVAQRTGPKRVLLKHPDGLIVAKPQLFELGLEATVKPLIAAGKRVVVVVDVPELPFFPRDCVRAPSLCSISVEQVEERQKIFRKIIYDVKARNPDMLVYDPLPALSNRGKAIYAFEGSLLYRDSHHMSQWGSEYLAKDLLQWLREQPEGR